MSSRAGDVREFSETQNSVKFRSLCSSCNNHLLGRKYDPVLKSFVASILKVCQTPLVVPDVISISTRPLALARAVIGHLLAAKGDFEETEYDKNMREFFLDEMQGKPKGLNLFYWFYPYAKIVVIRDVLMPSVRGRIGGSVSGFSMLKFFPVAFLVSDAEYYEGLSKIPFAQGMKSGGEANIQINLVNKYQERWPEAVDTGNFYIGGKPIESSVIAYEKR